MGSKLHNHCKEGPQNLGGTNSNIDKYMHQIEFNPSTSWGSYARHRHHLLHGARSTTDIRAWHKHATGELINIQFKGGFLMFPIKYYQSLKDLDFFSTRQICGIHHLSTV